jgi:hypothetical protein
VHCPYWFCNFCNVVSVGGPVCQEVCEGLRFDCVSPDELYYEGIDFDGPFSNSTYGFLGS